MKKPPRTIYVGPADYEVHQVKELGDLVGETQVHDTTILLKKSLSPAAKRITLVHELLHAILWESGAYKTVGLDNEKEEELVVTITPWIFAVFLQDNPMLWNYLTDAQEEAA